jgi:hypothetical protein
MKQNATGPDNTQGTPMFERTINATFFFVCAVYISLPIWTAIPDMEELYISVASTVFHAKQIFLHGNYPFWNPYAGLGMPHPFAQSFIFHPLMPMFAFLETEHALVLFYMFHAAAGTWGMFRLLKLLNCSPTTAKIGTIAYLFSNSFSQYYSKDLFLPQLFTITIFPWALVFLLNLVKYKRGLRDQCFMGAVGALLFGQLVSNSHVSHLFVFLPALVFGGLVFWREIRDNRYAFMIIILGFLPISMPLLWHIYRQASEFSLEASRDTYSSNFSFFEILLHPLTNIDWPASVRQWIRETGFAPHSKSFRTPGFGALLQVLAVVGLKFLLPKKSGYSEKTLFFVAGAFLLSCICCILPDSTFVPLLSMVSLFRDAINFFGVLLASVILSSLLEVGNRPFWLKCALIIQGLISIRAVYTPIKANHEYLVKLGQPSKYLVPRDPLSAILLANRDNRFSRTILTTNAEKKFLFPPRIGFNAPSIFTNGGMYIDRPIVNTIAKGISNNDIFPDWGLPYGRILSDNHFLADSSALNALGIEFIIVSADENFQHPSLLKEPIEASHTNSEIFKKFSLFRNPDAWPLITMHSQTYENRRPKIRKGCSFNGLLCRNFRPLNESYLPGGATIKAWSTDRIDISLHQPSENINDYNTGHLIFSYRYDSNWMAFDEKGNRLKIYKALDAIMGLDFSTQSNTISLVYAPRFRQLLHIICFGTMLVLIITIAGLKFQSLRKDWVRNKD